MHQAQVGVCMHSLHVCLLTHGFCPSIRLDARSSLYENWALDKALMPNITNNILKVILGFCESLVLVLSRKHLLVHLISEMINLH